METAFGIKNKFRSGKKKFLIILVIFIIILLLSLFVGGTSKKIFKIENEATGRGVAGIQTNPTAIPGSRSDTTKQLATVVKVIDGDTITVSINGKNEVVRIIGIDTPEVVDPRKKVECFGKEASEKAKVIFEENKTVLLESDPTQGERDRYQRLLRYVWIDDDKTDFGKFMIGEGYASEYTYIVPYKYQNEYKQVEIEASEAKRGLWADNACDSNTTISPTTKQQPSVNASDGDRDCSDFETHDEAQAYFEGKGGSPTNNVDRLDADGDGIACESLP
ncbi:MAG: hypothetical protein ACD_50C00175G0006 [uncultured bacterium]|nr:MAG: hypothetical protein ACD_50C00175G0006 [uncultured bacterium]OGH13599.1 MAG: hypothetical protein A2687_05555 [Candidatus Levybacteria bacterium RIFCSPHIGHO2_01_FULL_38_26]